MRDQAEALSDRLSLWNDIEKLPDGDISKSEIRDLNIYKGQSGVCRDDSGICISILNTGKHYPDDIFDGGVLYHYPNTQRAGQHDINEINSVKECASQGLPLFVILPGKNSTKRKIRLGWVEDFDDNSEQFLIRFGDSQPKPIQRQEEEFITKEKRKKKSREVEIRSNNQSKFRFDVLKRYGSKCAICNIENKHMLDAAHIIPVDEDGPDDPRNGLILCKNHHAAFDRNLFVINPNDYSIDALDNNINISEAKLNTATGLMPHELAIDYRFKA